MYYYYYLKKILITLGWVLFSLGFLQGQSQIVYPGDVNNNGIVNGVDALYVGVAFDTEGPQRENASKEFQPQAITALWAENFPDGLNYAYADCNGNGKIEEDDIKEVIKDNFGKTHGVLQPDSYSAEGNPLADPFLNLVPDLPTATGGQQVTVTLSLGSMDVPVNNFYGIAFTINIDADLLKADSEESLDFETPENPWFAPSGESKKLSIKQNNQGKIDVVLTRTNQQAITGFGEIGKLSFVIIEDVVVAREIAPHIKIDNIVLLDDKLKIMPVTTDTTNNPTTNVVTSILDPAESDIKIYPNPASHFVKIATESSEIQQVRLSSLYGQEFFNQGYSILQKDIEIPTAQLSNGIYILEIHTPKGRLTKKILVAAD